MSSMHEFDSLSLHLNHFRPILVNGWADAWGVALRTEARVVEYEPSVSVAMHHHNPPLHDAGTWLMIDSDI
jgi:hypothetical protein